MKRQSLVLLAVAVLSAGAVGCFSDPTSGLRSGPSVMSLQYTVVHMAVGDSLTFNATVLDKQGNTYPATGATFTSASTAVARAGIDNSLIIPDNYYVRGYITGVAAGSTTVTVTARGVSAKATVTVQ
jgi:hypothetical protein